MTNRNYSRLARVEENKNIRTTVIFGGLTILFIIFLVFFGIPIVARLAGWISDLKSGKQTQQADNSNNSPLLPPNITPPPEFTNKNNLDVKGTGRANSIVSIFFNDNTQDVTTDDSGNFAAGFNLIKGENTLSAKSKDKNGNLSSESKKYIIVFDNEPPKLQITNPTDGAAFFGDSQKQITIQGHTDPETQVTVNDRIAIVESSGQFKVSYSLSNGDNSFTATAVDRAGNKTEVKFKVSFSP